MSYKKFLDELSRYGREKFPNEQLKPKGKAWLEQLTRLQNELEHQWLQQERLTELAKYIQEAYDTGGGDAIALETFRKLKIAKEIKVLRDVSSSWLRAKKETLNWEKKSRAESLEIKKNELLLEVAEREISNLLEDSKARIKDSEKVSTSISDLSDFWAIIDAGRKGNRGILIQRYEETLRVLSPEHLVYFQKKFISLHSESYTSDLWALAYLVRGGCGDDEFDYFRAWLILQGRKLYELAQKDVVAAAMKLDLSEDPQCEELLYLAEEIYEEKTGKAMPEFDYPKYELKGIHWKENELQARFPELFAMYNRK